MTLTAKPPKPRVCSVCTAEFTPHAGFITWCGFDCGAVLATTKLQKKKKAAAAKDKRETKAKLDDMRSKRQLVALAQKAFNSFIRARDADKPCISCGKNMATQALGGAFDCGHYRSVGAAVHMRFVEDNAHAQCKYCNRHLAGNHVEYRAGLIERIGLRSVKLIERDQTLRKYAKEGLLEIARHYNAEARRLKATL